VNKTVAQCLIICSLAVVITLSVISPWVLSDNNLLLSKFIEQGGFLSFLGVIVTITLASATNLHLELNKMEEKYQKRIFIKTRGSIRKSSFWLISLLLVAILIASTKSLLCKTVVAESIANGACLLIVLFNILFLVDLTQTAFALEPDIR